MGQKEVTSDSFLGGLYLVLSCNRGGAGVRELLSCNQSVPLKELACSFGLHVFLCYIALGEGKSISWQNFCTHAHCATKLRPDPHFLLSFSHSFLHHFNRTKKFYKQDTYSSFRAL